MTRNVQRSMMILPVHVQRFVEKAHLRGADAIVLDMEDAVPPGEKKHAREVVRSATALVGRGGADVLVRVNNEADLLELDLDASIHPGLHAIFIPKVEDKEDVLGVESMIESLERDRGLAPSQVKLAIHIESPKGLMNLKEIAAASDRIESMSLGVDDYCLELGVEPSSEGTELFLPFTMMVHVCKAFGILPMGILGSVSGYQDLASFEAAANRGKQLGSVGGYCVHPGQVEVLNRVFSPTKEAVDHARRVVEAFEAGLKEGRAAITMDDMMIDTPIYKRALSVLELADVIAARESRKQNALEHGSTD